MNRTNVLINIELSIWGYALWRISTIEIYKTKFSQNGKKWTFSGECEENAEVPIMEIYQIKNLIQSNFYSCNQLPKLIQPVFYNFETQLSKYLSSFPYAYFKLTDLQSYSKFSELIAIQIP